MGAKILWHHSERWLHQSRRGTSHILSSAALKGTQAHGKEVWAIWNERLQVAWGPWAELLSLSLGGSESFSIVLPCAPLYKSVFAQ